MVNWQYPFAWRINSRSLEFEQDPQESNPADWKEKEILARFELSTGGVSVESFSSVLHSGYCQTAAHTLYAKYPLLNVPFIENIIYI